MISDELNKAKDFNRNDNGDVELTIDNVGLAETVYNLFYINSTLENDFTELEEKYSEENLKKVCTRINAENSTHLTNEDKDIICECIYKKCPNINLLKEELEKDSYPLIELIRKAQNNNGVSTKKNNYSFATKFCHYACYYLYKNEDEKKRDLYPIYDSILSDYVKKSPEYKLSTDTDINKYEDYVKIIDKIISGKGISRNGFDHLIWLTNRKPSKTE